MAATGSPLVARIDGMAWILLFTGSLVSLAIFSHETSLDERTLPNSSNLFGKPGAWLASELFGALGLSVYALLASWFVLVILLLLRKNWTVWSKRFLGWALLVPCSAVAFDWIGPDQLGTLPGGAIGALLRARIEAEFGPLGGPVVFAVVTAFATLLSLDFFIVHMMYAAWDVCQFLGFIVGAPMRGVAHLAAARPVVEKEAVEEVLAPKITALSGVPILHVESPLVAEAEVETEPEPERVKVGEAPRILRIQNPTPEMQERDLHRFDDFELPPITLLGDPEPFPFEAHDQKLRETAILLEKTFQDFDLNVKVVGINTGPVITQYEVSLETGMRVNKVTGLADDLALHMKVPSVRIVAPIPGKNTVGIEVPNEQRAVVRLKELILGAGRKLTKCKLPLFLGKDTEGRPLIYDLAEMPHLLIAGTTGTGKSVCLNSIITSILMARRPDEAKMILIDPKSTELIEFSKIPHMMHPVVIDMKKAEAILAWAVEKMEERYDLLSRCRVRNIASYNELGIDEIKKRLCMEPGDDSHDIQAKIPYIVIVVDELADLMMLMKREVETHIIRLAQKSRAAGIHLVLATQKPTVDVITGLIKSNLPGRICFKVSSRTDSRVVLDEMGADKLLGKGDMLFLQPGTSLLIRAQGTYVSDQEITKMVAHLETNEPCYDASLVSLKPTGSGPNIEKLKSRDDLYENAVDIVIREGRGSVSLLQRALGIGYGRAARLVDFMAEDGIVGAYNGSNAREVVITPEEWADMRKGVAAAS
ncbi:MAG: DNA translocase FtsK 4TM domain-containing protein [Planctomycetota bacterium]